ncbi:MAG: cellulase family glycosylhydrolase [Oscillospiraceae bacterium]|jgi:endoglycosylceramidase|nr:cellulase family glycosylhydrolase [Oscillospiraceae bacterium]
MDTIAAKGMRFVDAQGRERIFHGLNYGKIKELDLDENFFEQCNTLGFNVLRLCINWEFIEPAQGRYDEEYLRRIDAILALAAQYHVHVFLDMHQDMYSAFGIGEGDGAPLWACVPDGAERGHAKKVWAEGYFFSKAVHNCFNHFWANDPVSGKGLQAHYAALWQMLARRYGDSPALLGFDVMNEPFPNQGGKIFRKMVGSLVSACLTSPKVHRLRLLKNLLQKQPLDQAALDVVDPWLLRKATGAADDELRKFDHLDYTLFLARMQKALREVTPNGLFMFEHSYYHNLGQPFHAQVPAGETKAVYSPHAYDFTVDTPAYAYASNERVHTIFAAARDYQQRAGVPVLVGEWGGGGPNEDYHFHIAFLLDLFDQWGWSNAYYAYTPGAFNDPIMQVLSRPYPTAVNGLIESLRVNTKEQTLTLRYTPAATDLPTEIYLPNGFLRVETADGTAPALTQEGHILKVKTTSAIIKVFYV